MVESNFIIKFTPVANNDLEEIYSYISRELFAEDAAVSLLNRIEKKIMQLKNSPYSGSYLVDNFLCNKGYRKLIIDHYIVVENKRQVIIMRVLYGLALKDVGLFRCTSVRFRASYSECR